jgi:hypothetical protein
MLTWLVVLGLVLVVGSRDILAIITQKTYEVTILSDPPKSPGSRNENIQAIINHKKHLITLPTRDLIAGSTLRIEYSLLTDLQLTSVIYIRGVGSTIFLILSFVSIAVMQRRMKGRKFAIDKKEG